MAQAGPGRPPRRNPFARARLTGVLALGLAGTVLGILAAAVLMQALVLAPADRAHQRAIGEARVELVAAELDTVAAFLRASTQRLATAPETARILREGDPTAIAELEARHAATLPGALRVRVNDAGGADIALTEVPPLTFAGLDLVRAAEEGRLAGPEYLVTEAGPVLNLAAPVPGDDGRPLGSVLVTLSNDRLNAALAALPTASGGFTVLQRFPGAPEIEIASTGGNGTGAFVEHPLAVPNWALRHDPPALTSIAPAVAAAPAWLAALLLAGGALLLAHRRMAQAVRADLDRLVASAGAVARGRPPAPAGEFVLDEFAATAATMVAGSAPSEPPPAVAVDRASASAYAQTQEMKVVELDAAAALVDEPGTGAGETASGSSAERISEAEGGGDAGADAEADAEADDDFLEIDEEGSAQGDDFAMEQEAPGAEAPTEAELPPEVVFRDYDIRGVVGEQLTAAHARLLGRAVGSAVVEAGEDAMAVAGDCRLSTDELKAALIEGITAAGVDVVDLGEVPTPVLYHTTHTTPVRSGVIVTGSHSAPAYNGMKIVIGGETLVSGRIAALRERIREGRFSSGSGSVRREDGIDRYVEEIVADIALAQPLKVVVDCGNGVAGVVAPRLLEALGCDVLPLYCDPDGTFPNHHPDPADPANMADLATIVRAEEAHVGIALDGDGDRIGAVDEKGEIIWPDRLMMLFARDIVGRNPGADVIFDVKCSRHLNGLVAEYGGRPIMWKTGHAHLKAKMRETGALLGGELSGHISFGERWHGFDDGLYSAARLLEIIAGEAKPVSRIFARFPAAVATPEIRVPVDEAKKFLLMEKLIESGVLDKGDVTTIDGLRVDYPDGWGLVRASNTEPALTLRFEADTVGAVHEIVDEFKRALRELDPAIDFTIKL